MFGTGTRRIVVAGAVLAALLISPGIAQGTPPANDNRATAEVIPSFPATITGTTVEATVERLDPQVSDCGRVEGTLWYRINQAPDGTIVLDVQGAGFAPVLRVYDLLSNSIDELTCDSAKKSAKATVSFRPSRGKSYLVMVGKRPTTADATFTLTARLFLPPPNDTLRQARKIRASRRRSRARRSARRATRSTPTPAISAAERCGTRCPGSRPSGSPCG